MPEILIIPSILTNNKKDLFEKLELVDNLFDRVQVDIVGKAFASELTLGVEVLEEISSSLALDVQLMVKEPVSFLHQCDLAGVDRVFGHVEHMRSKSDFIEHVLALGMQVGLGLDLETPVFQVEKLLADLDAILLMSVPAGKSGQEFDERVITKILEVRSLQPELSICVDGGINPLTIGGCVEAGANEFAVGSFLWESKDIKGDIEKLIEAGE